MKSLQNHLQDILDQPNLNESITEAYISSNRYKKTNTAESFTNSELYFLHKRYKRASIRKFLN